MLKILGSASDVTLARSLPSLRAANQTHFRQRADNVLAGLVGYLGSPVLRGQSSSPSIVPANEVPLLRKPEKTTHNDSATMFQQFVAVFKSRWTVCVSWKKKKMFPQQMLHVGANGETFRITMFLQPRDISSSAGTFMVDPAVLCSMWPSFRP